MMIAQGKRSGTIAALGKAPNLERRFARLLVLVPHDRLPPPVWSLADSATLAGL